MKGIVNLYKPKGWTSRDAVNKVRNILHVKEVGHMGTLDPQGEGVLPIGIGKGTRLFDALLKKDKVYEAEFAFGYETPTLDGDSEPSRFAKTIPSQSEIESKLDEFVGVIRQVPPLYSAKNVNGARAYDLARKGVDFTLEAAEVEVYSFELIKRTAENTYLMRIHCSAGTYIRSLCRDLAYSLDSLATMVSIKRVRAGGFRIEESVTVEELRHGLTLAHVLAVHGKKPRTIGARILRRLLIGASPFPRPLPCPRSVLAIRRALRHERALSPW